MQISLFFIIRYYFYRWCNSIVVQSSKSMLNHFDTLKCIIFFLILTFSKSKLFYNYFRQYMLNSKIIFF